MKPRSRHRILVSYSASIQCDAGTGEGLLLDLSPTGCRLQSKAPLNAGAYVALQIAVGDESNPLGVEVSVVRWSKDGHLGIEFLRYGQGDRERVANLVGGYSAAQSPPPSLVIDGSLCAVGG